MSTVRGIQIPVEVDMEKRPYAEEEKFSSKVFKTYPLIGEFIPKESTIEKWHLITREYIEKKLENRSVSFHKWVYEQVTLIIVHYAKSWNSNEEGKFTKYVTMQLGYKDDSGRIWSVLTDALETAFTYNRRLFIRRNGDRQFYETVMVHSFGPNGAWYPMIDLLFSFYTDNLDWTYIPGDPLFQRLVSVLQGYFNYTESEDDLYVIASHKYGLRIGIRRLVQERPGYSRKLFESIVNRIQQLLKNDAEESRRYSYRLVDQWFSDRISNSTTITKRRSTLSHKSAELALDYSKVSIRYCISDGRLALYIPAIRLVDDNQNQPTAILYDADRPIGNYNLEILGNELGETIKQKMIILPMPSSDDLQYRLVIMRGDDVIHDTDNKLWRQIVFFSEGKEISINRLRRQKYDVFVPNIGKLQGSNIDFEPHLNGMFEMALHKDYSIEYAGNTLALDTSEIKGIRIIRPDIVDDARYVSDGEEYYLLKKGGSLKAYFEKEADAKQYQIEMNGEYRSLSEFFDSFAGNRSVIPVEKSDGKTSLSIIDIAAGTVIFKENYYIISDFSCSFNRKVYISDEDYNTLSAKIRCNGVEYSLGSANRNELRFDYADGQILIDIPGIQPSYSGITTVFFEKYLRADDISEESKLTISNRMRIPYTLVLGDKEVGEVSCVSLAHVVSQVSNTVKKFDIFLKTAERQYLLGVIVFGNIFAHQPNILFTDNCLYWDGGSSFVGDADAELFLELKKEEETRYSFELELGKQLIFDFEAEVFADDQYDWVIYANGQSVIQGNTFIGNVSKARFVGKTISIDRVTEDIEGNSKPVSIKTVYIDQIKYQDTCYVETEEDIYDVYTGCMFWTDRYGERRYYSFKYNDKASKYKINPVKIIYISDKYLRIVNEDDEGIFCFYNKDSYSPGYEITDREPPLKAKNYHDILFYLFDIKDGERAFSARDIEKKTPDARAVITKLPSVRKPVQKEKRMVSVNCLRNLQTVSQETVIQSPVEKRILVNAGPGTGKTWTLIERIIHLVQEGTEPETIQVLCFSRAAVEVVRSRMADAVSTGRVEAIINLVDIRTFDSFASQLLYWVKDSDYTEIGKNYRIEALNYEERIGLFIRILKAQPGLIEQCEHLIVDEVQDLVLNRAEMVLDMIRLLPGSSGVTLFGDACQAIYDYQADTGMSSEDFYRGIEELEQFSYYSFDHNYRQTSRLQDYCNDYRTAILTGNQEACNECLNEIQDTLPDYTTVNLKQFQEDSLDMLLKAGNAGILTRSNAQAMVISGMFHRKNIAHSLQRRLSDNYLNGWIAAMFNTLPERYYTEDSFVTALSGLFSDRYSEQEARDIWNAITSFGKGAGGLIPVAELLRGIRDHGRVSQLYLDNPVSKVTVSTIHRSKGREYDSVIILDSLISEKPDSQEEQRVNYVALSRAKEHMYKVEMPDVFFRTLDNRRCYSAEKNFRTGKSYLRRFEVGRPGDFSRYSFCTREGVQQYIRDNIDTLRDRELYLEKTASGNEYVSYSIKLKHNDMIIGETGRAFAEDLESAIRKVKNLPWHASVMEYVYPRRFSEIYIMDVASETGMIQGNETGIMEYDSMAVWNIVLAEGYARAEY